MRLSICALIMAVNITSLNVRGLKDRNKRRKIFQSYKKSCDILCLQETHTTKEQEIDWLLDWGGKIIFSHGASNARGCAMLFSRNFSGGIKPVAIDTDGRYILMQINLLHQSLLLGTIYAPNTDSPGFFLEMFEKVKLYDKKVIVGDFNLVLNTQLDRNASMSNNGKAAQQLNSIMEEQLVR